MNFIIKAAEVHHLDEICAIEAESFKAPWPRVFFVEELNSPNSINLAAFVGDRVAGYLFCRQIVNEGHIANIAVGLQFRGRGIGGSLMDYLMNIGQKRGFVGFTLEVAAGNKAAQNLYLKHGFVPEGLRKNYYAETNEDAIIMWKYLNAEAART